LNAKKNTKVTKEPLSRSTVGDLDRAHSAVIDDELPDIEAKDTLTHNIDGENSDEMKEMRDSAIELERNSKGESKTNSLEEIDSDTDTDGGRERQRGRDRGESKRDEDALSGEEKTDTAPHTSHQSPAPSLVDIMKNKIHPRMKVDLLIPLALSSSKKTFNLLWSATLVWCYYALLLPHF
jgi:hypothetical protein